MLPRWLFYSTSSSSSSRVVVPLPFQSSIAVFAWINFFSYLYSSIWFDLYSSSSMKISSKSIPSPGRAREPSQISLSSSLSRRLKNSGSMKGSQASQMFPTGGKKRGCTFDNPEPSSPKVTCIGQVRIKTKKQGKKMRTRSKRRSEASIRKPDQNLQSIAGQQDNTNNNNNNMIGPYSCHCLWTWVVREPCKAC